MDSVALWDSDEENIAIERVFRSTLFSSYSSAYGLPLNCLLLFLYVLIHYNSHLVFWWQLQTDRFHLYRPPILLMTAHRQLAIPVKSRNNIGLDLHL